MSYNPNPGPDPEAWYFMGTYFSLWVILVILFGQFWGTVALFMVTVSRLVVD